MRQGFIFLLLVIIFSDCNKAKSYKEGMKQCEANPETIQLIDPVENDTIMSQMIPQDCIEGYLLPDFMIETMDGEQISTESLKGKLSIINFWFQNCPPCIAEIPGFNRLKEKYGTKSVNYIAISTDSEEDVRDFLMETSFNFQHVADGEHIYRDSFQAKWGFPFTIVTNRENVIIKSFGGGPTDTTAIQKLIDKIEPILMAEKVSVKSI